MIYGVRRTTQPASEPVTLAEVKLSLRVDHADDDEMIASMITAAREHCEARIQRTLQETELRLTLPAFPGCGRSLYLPQPPILTVDAVSYYDTTGTLVTLTAGTHYRVCEDGDLTVLEPVSGAWPTTQTRTGAVQIDYTAGYETCPEPIRRWIILAVGDMYARRERSSDRPSVPEQFADGLLDQYCVWATP